MKTKNKYPYGLLALFIAAFAMIVFCLFYPINKKEKSVALYIDYDDNVDSIALKIDSVCNNCGGSTLMALARHTNYESNIRTGRYEINTSIGALAFYRKLRNGQQDPVKLIIPSVRTKDRLANELSKKMMMTQEEILDFINNNDSCAIFGLDTASIITLFIPNTYEVYWNLSVGSFLKKMKSEKERFWNKERQAKAIKLNLTPEEVMTLASIVDEETANNLEKNKVAGMYYNRLQKNMPLQADPTIKFALKDFSIRRIYNKMLKVESPFNTYMHEGLPPGPIRIPSIVGIEAVLNMEKHDFLYMCAKEDFSGTHNFARTYEEHLQNAARYTEALNQRNIGKYGREQK